MTLENDLLTKTYYKKFNIENEKNDSIQSLAEMYLTEQKKESPNLAYIRFSQGEMYFHYKDFETAIFKWEDIHNELEPWAKKNMADAYYELGILSSAEDIYKSIESGSLSLNTEIALKLFSMYVDQGRLDQATKIIKNFVSINPDYPNLTNMARSFFEEYKDWSSAIQLAVNEAIRTESLEWFAALKTYIDEGFTTTIAPDYFSKALHTLFNMNQLFFEELVSSLWKSYKNEEMYFSWITVFNNLFLEMEVSQTEGWRELPFLFQETYFELIKGDYLVRELSEIAPILLTNWLKVTDSSNSLLASTAVLSWSEAFPSSIGSSLVNEAEGMMKHSDEFSDRLEHSLDLFESIAKWAQNNGLDVEHDLTELVKKISHNRNISEERNEKLLYCIRKTIAHLFDKRVEFENRLVKSINWNEEVVSKLNGAVNQLNDIENEKIQRMKESYILIKEEIKDDLIKTIPTLLRECSTLINDNSDLGSIHVKLDAEMNKAIRNYIQQTILPKFTKSIQEWIQVAKEEFTESQSYLEGMNEGFKTLYEKEYLTLSCDFQVLHDWIRDADRMATGVDMEKVNILSGYKQFLLKSSGKLLGAIPTNKIMIYKAYQKFIENENYDQVTVSFINQFMMQFELFGKAIERDIKMFFRGPFKALEEAIEEGKINIVIDKESLNKLKTNPEIYFDPLTLFEVRLRQYELMMGKGRRGAEKRMEPYPFA